MLPFYVMGQTAKDRESAMHRSRQRRKCTGIMAGKQKKGRQAYLNDIKINENGQYVYQGTYYIWNEEKKSRKRALGELWASCMVMLAAAVGAGCLPVPGVGNCVYVLAPYVAQIMAVVSVCWALARLSAGGNPLREYVYLATMDKLPKRTALTAVFAAAAAVGEGIYVIKNTIQEKIGIIILFIFLEIAALAAAGIMSFLLSANIIQKWNNKKLTKNAEAVIMNNTKEKS